MRYVLNITVPFPQDDNLFIHELIDLFPIATGMISFTLRASRSASGEMHSSHDSCCCSRFLSRAPGLRGKPLEALTVVRQPSIFATDQTKSDPR